MVLTLLSLVLATEKIINELHSEKTLPFITQQLRTDWILDLAAFFSLLSSSVLTLVLPVVSAQFLKNPTDPSQFLTPSISDNGDEKLTLPSSPPGAATYTLCWKKKKSASTEHTPGFLPQRAKFYQPGARKVLIKKNPSLRGARQSWLFANQGVQTSEGR